MQDKNKQETNIHDVVRIKEYHTERGETYYIPQRKIKKFFGGEKWECFSYGTSKFSISDSFFPFSDLFVSDHPELQSLEVANNICRRYVKCYYCDRIVKVWKAKDISL